MTSDATDMQAVLERLDRLEGQNRWLKRGATVVLLMLSTLALTAQRSTNKAVEANEFILTDEHGRTRADLNVVGGAPGLTIYDTRGKARAILALGKDGPFLLLNAADRSKDLSLSSDSLVINRNGVIEAILEAADDGPTLRLTDSRGFHSILGMAGTERPSTGETRQTSAASLVMFGKEGSIIWRAP